MNSKPSSQRHPHLQWLWLSGIIIIVDQLTKQLAVNYLELLSPKPILPFFNLTLVYNKGIAFNFFSRAGFWEELFLILAVLIACSLILYFFIRISSERHLLASSLAIILGGALGNVIDRLHYGYVVDFLDFHIGHWHWPAFNVADTAITIGALLLIIDILRTHRQTS